MVAIFLIAGLCGIHLIFRTHFLYDWDTVQFALALERFDVLNHRPHPPGYILLVGLARLIHLLVADANETYLILNIVGLFASAWLLTEIGRRLFSRHVGQIAVLLYLLSPLTLFNFNIAGAYIIDGACALGIVWAAVRALDSKDRRSVLILAGVFGLAAGVRQNLLVIFLPLTLWATSQAIAQHRKRLNIWILAAGVFVGAVLIWAVPLLASSGGLHSFRQVGSELLTYQFQQTSLLYGISLAKFLKISLRLLAWIFLLGLGAGSVVLLAGGRQGKLRVFIQRSPALWLTWLAPSLLFFLFFHLPKPGYLLCILGAFTLAVATVIAALKPRARTLVLVTLGIASLLQFAAMPPPAGNPSLNLIGRDYGWGALRAKDRAIGDLISFVRQTVDPSTTALVTENFPTSHKVNRRWFRHVMFYLPEYQTLEIADGAVFSVRDRREEGATFAAYEKAGFLKTEQWTENGDLLPVEITKKKLAFVTGDFIPPLPRPGWEVRVSPQGQPIFLADLTVQNEIAYGKVLLVRSASGSPAK